jgi:hypothetical protein
VPLLGDAIPGAAAGALLTFRDIGSLGEVLPLIFAVFSIALSGLIMTAGCDGTRFCARDMGQIVRAQRILAFPGNNLLIIFVNRWPDRSTLETPHEPGSASALTLAQNRGTP